MSNRDMSRLDLAKVFDTLRDCAYCIIKRDPVLPDYRPGSDVDMFCFDVNEVARVIVAALGRQLSNDAGLQVNREDKHCHLDVVSLADGELIFRFDLYGALPAYRMVRLRPALFESVMEGRRRLEIGSGDRRCVIQVPTEVDEMLLRYVEYHEWYAQRPDKIKHMEYVMAGTLPKREQFLAKLHHYTALPGHVPEPQPVTSCGALTAACLGRVLRKASRLPGRLFAALLVRIRRRLGVFR